MAALSIVLRVVDAYVASGVDHQPRLEPIQRARDGLGIRDVELAARGHVKGEMALGAQLLERTAKGTGSSGDQDGSHGDSPATRICGVLPVSCA